MRVAALILIALIATASDSARIYVFSRRDTPAKSWMSVSCGNAAVADIKQGFFFALNVEPGSYTLSVKNGVPRNVQIHPGEDIFLRLDWDHGIDRDPIPLFSPVAATQAQVEMQYLTYVSAKQMHSAIVSKTDPRPPLTPHLRTRAEQ